MRGPRPYNAFWGSVKRTFNTHRHRDGMTRDRIKQELLPMIPLRSGLLMDTVFSSMFIIRETGVTTGDDAGGGFSLTITPTYPADRPSIFAAQWKIQHHGELGYGPIYAIKDRDIPDQWVKDTPMRKDKRGVYWSSGKSAIYRMNDPLAERPVLKNIKEVIAKHLKREMQQLFRRYQTVTWIMDIKEYDKVNEAQLV